MPTLGYLNHAQVAREHWPQANQLAAIAITNSGEPQ